MLEAIVVLTIMILHIIKWIALTLTAVTWMLALVNDEFPYYLILFPLIAVTCIYLIHMLKSIGFE